MRTRHAGRMTFIGFTSWFRETFASLSHMKFAMDRSGLKADLSSNAVVTIHVEPEGKAKLSGVPVL